MDYIRPSTLVWLYAIASTNIIYSISQFVAFDCPIYMRTIYYCEGEGSVIK